MGNLIVAVGKILTGHNQRMAALVKTSTKRQQLNNTWMADRRKMVLDQNPSWKVGKQ